MQHTSATLQVTPDSQGARRPEDDGLSSTIDPHSSREMGDTEGAQGEDVEYASLQFREKSGALRRYASFCLFGVRQLFSATFFIATK